jgi:tRNA dimethylallyltransferase
VPFLVGGSGLYVDAVVFDYKFPRVADAGRRAELEAMDDESLRELLAAEDPEAYERVDLANRRRVVRAIETAGQGRARLDAPRAETLMLGLMLNKKVVQQRIETRVRKMLEKGFLDEVREIGERYGWDSEALTVIGYRAFKDVVRGSKSEAEGIADFVRGDMALYKKQVTWFKRGGHIRWLENPAEAEGLVREFLGRPGIIGA